MHIARVLAAISACAGPEMSGYAVQRAEQARAPGRSNAPSDIRGSDIGGDD